MLCTPIVFDLDGTLIDSKLDLALSVNAALERFGMEPLEHEIIYSFVGNGVKQLIVDTLTNKNRMDIFDEFYRYFLDYYSDHLLDNTTLYEGVRELLNALHGEFCLFVVTNKSLSFARRILEALGVIGFFKDIVGGDTFENKKPHPQQVEWLAGRWGFEPAGKLMVGDSENDLLLASNLDMVSVWASYGFRDKSILKRYRADYVIEKPLELLGVVERWRKAYLGSLPDSSSAG